MSKTIKVRSKLTALYWSKNFNLPHFPLFLTQTHSTRVITEPYEGNDLEADAVYTNQPNQVCLVMTADCLPVLFTNKQGTEVAAAHAGWRGLCDGVLEETVKCFQSAPEEIIAWLGLLSALMHSKLAKK